MSDLPTTRIGFPINRARQTIEIDSSFRYERAPTGIVLLPHSGQRSGVARMSYPQILHLPGPRDVLLPSDDAKAHPHRANGATMTSANGNRSDQERQPGSKGAAFTSCRSHSNRHQRVRCGGGRLLATLIIGRSLLSKIWNRTSDPVDPERDVGCQDRRVTGASR